MGHRTSHFDAFRLRLTRHTEIGSEILMELRKLKQSLRILVADELFLGLRKPLVSR